MPTSIEQQAKPHSVLVSWSGGKDSCMALQEILRTPNMRVEALLTTVTQDYDRISMHGVRRELLERQARSLGLPLELVHISKGATNEEYEKNTAAILTRHFERGIRSVVFGDLFLEDIRAYRQRLMAGLGMSGLYPLWQRDTSALIKNFVNDGFKTAIVCVDPSKLDPSFAGRVIDDRLLEDLPPGVDPCGENGEFHTFVFDGPLFVEPVKFSFGEVVHRDGFWFCYLIPDAQD